MSTALSSSGVGGDTKMIVEMDDHGSNADMRVNTMQICFSILIMYFYNRAMPFM